MHGVVKLSGIVAVLLAAPLLAATAPAGADGVEGSAVAGYVQARKLVSTCAYSTSAFAPVWVVAEGAASANVTVVLPIAIYRDNAADCLAGPLEAGLVVNVTTHDLVARTFLTTAHKQFVGTLEIPMEVHVAPSESITFPTHVYLRRPSALSVMLSETSGTFTVAGSQAAADAIASLLDE